MRTEETMRRLIQTLVRKEASEDLIEAAKTVEFFARSTLRPEVCLIITLESSIN